MIGEGWVGISMSPMAKVLQNTSNRIYEAAAYEAAATDPRVRPTTTCGVKMLL